MTTPTIVIGLGQAGCRMVNQVDQVVKHEGKQDAFKFFTIDTNGGDLENESPDWGNVTPIHLEKPQENFFRDDREDFAYLDAEYELKKEEGTGRTRPISRYHIEEYGNFVEVREQLRRGMLEFVNESQVAAGTPTADFHVWILNSLGGGTGSGAFPVVAALVHEITEQWSEQYLINGIGSLPRLDRIAYSAMEPEGRNVLYANAYAALAELRELVNDDPASSPTVRIESDVLNPGEAGLSWSGPVFDKYWMIGFSEEESDDRAYRERMNRIAANGIYYLSNKDQPEDFPYVGTLDEEVLSGITAAELRVPVEDAREFVRLREEIDDLEAEIERLGEEIDHHEGTVDYLTEVRRLNIDLEAGVPDDLEHVSGDLIEECLNAPYDFDPGEDLAGVRLSGSDVDRGDVTDLVDELLADATDRTLAHVREPKPAGDAQEFTREDVVVRFYCEALSKHLETHLDGHAFQEAIETVWDEWYGEIEDYVPNQFASLETLPPDRKWEGALKAFIREFGTALEEKRDGTIRPIKRMRLTREIDRLADHFDRLSETYDQYKKLTVLQNVVETRYRNAKERLTNAKTERLERDVLEEKTRRKRDRERDLKNKRARRESLEDTLTTRRREQADYILGLQNVDRLTTDLLYRSISVEALIDAELVDEAAVNDELRGTSADVETLLSSGLLDEEGLEAVTDDMVTNWPSIASLVENDIVDVDTLAEDLSDLLESPALTEDPIQDHPRTRETRTRSILGVMVSEENETGSLGDIMDLSVEGGQDLREVITASFDEYIGEKVYTSDGLSVRLVGWFMPAELENTSEFGTLNEHFVDATSDTREQLGPDFTDEAISRSFAYPELFEDGSIAERLEQLGRT